MPLEKYHQKRKFDKTPEPKGGKSQKKSKLIFVVQRHGASRLHYDFRLEMEGVLKSWAVPKGPSLNPSDKRLAVMVEDHPYDYKDFEGTIPKGNYGAGEVEIWDAGTYEPLHAVKNKKDETVLLQELKDGSLKLVLNGEKLKGEFALVKMKTADEGNNWLLIKHKDEFAVSENYDAENFTEKSSDVSAFLKERKTKSGKKYYGGRVAEKEKDFIKPMLATTGNEPFDDDEWVFEIKWDGYRAIAETGNPPKLYSRNGISFAKRYPFITEALKQQKHQMILDGEIVAYNESGMPQFQLLQHYEPEDETLLVYHVFDLLFLNGHSTEALTLLQRKELLKEALVETDYIQYNDHVVGTGKSFFNAVLEKDMEGIIAKKSDSAYAAGFRSIHWVKFKNNSTTEVVICGYTDPSGSRSYFGSLILGRFIGGKLIFAGHSGSGFNEKTLKEIHDELQPLKTEKSPFSPVPKTNGKPHWVMPERVCTIKFTEETRDASFRHPVFIGMREDMDVDDLKSSSQLDLTSPEPPISSATKPKTPVSKTNPPRQSAQSASAPKKSPAKKPLRQSAQSAGSKNQSAGAQKNSTEKKPLRKSAQSAGSKNQSAGSKNQSPRSKPLITNPQKIYFPNEGITKGQVIEYYNRMSKYILPHLKNRPQSLNRFPNGISEPGFYHKDSAENAPDFVDSLKIYSESSNRDIDYIICNNKSTLLYLANLGCIDMNPWASRSQNLQNPDYLIMDLDPSEKNNFEEVIEAALATHEVLQSCGAASYCKTSGASGIHVYVPLGAKYDYDIVRNFGNLIALKVNELLPDTTTLERSLSKRARNKIYLDYLQNRRGQTVASVYSLRPKPGATASAPLEWKEVKKGLHPSDFDIHTLPVRVEKTGDIFKPVLGKGIDIAKCLNKLGA